MTLETKRASLATLAAVTLGVAALSSLPAPARAQAVDCNADEQAGNIPESSYRAIELAIEDLSNDAYAEAEARLLKVTDRSEGYERAIVFQTLGFVYAQQEQLKPALEAFEEALATGALPLKSQEDLTYNVGQIYIADEQYERGVETITRYFEIACAEPPAAAHMMIANAHAQLSQYEPALEQVRQALAKTDDVQESWLQLKLALHYELKDFDACAETLIELIAMTPDSGDYWKQLSGVLLEVEQPEDSLAVLALAKRQGLLDSERDVKSIASVYMLLEIPFKAGLVFEEGLASGLVEPTADNYEYLSDTWIAAREWDKAEASLRLAAEKSPNGDLWKRLAQVMMEKEDWQAAKDALELAVDAGVSDEGQTHYLLGVAAYQAGDMSGAERALRAAVSDPESGQQARQWLDHIAANR